MEESEIGNGFINLDIETLISDEAVYFSELFSGFHIIPLETKENVVLGNISNIKFKDEIFFCFDRMKTRKVYLFSKDGSFISSVGNIGRGPGEYMYAVDFDVDTIEKRVAIYDGRKLNFYDYHGKFTGKITFDHGFQTFLITENHLVFYRNPHRINNPDENLIYLFDREGKEITTLVENTGIYMDAMQFFMGGHFFQWQNNTRFFMPYTETIYSISEKEAKPFIQLRTNRYKITSKELSEINTSRLHPMASGIEKLFLIRKYSENEKLCFFNFNIGMRRYQTFHYFDSNKTICTSRFIDDLTFINPEFIQLNNNQMIAIIHETQISIFKKLVSDGKINLTEKEKASLLEIPDYNNPIIVLFDI